MSGTAEGTNQGSFIPASQRPDGSWRKPRRVKEGYVPQEEVPLYESKGKQWANNKARQYPVGLDAAIIKAREEAKAAAARTLIPGLVIENEGKKKKKKKKSKESGVLEQSGAQENCRGDSEFSTNLETANEWQTVLSKSAKISKAEPVTQSTAVVVDPAKKLKNLKKKLREIEAIEKRIASGEIKKPDKDQVEKINRKSDVLSEILSLELTLGEH